MGKSPVLFLKMLGDGEVQLSEHRSQRPEPTDTMKGTLMNAQTALDRAFEPLVKAIREAHEDGDFYTPRHLREQLCKAKLSAMARADAAGGPNARRFGPNVSPLVTNRRALPDDPTIMGVGGGAR